MMIQLKSMVVGTYGITAGVFACQRPTLIKRYPKNNACDETNANCQDAQDIFHGTNC
jgi:hypothetical protein